MNQKILIVDDERGVVDMLKSYFELHDFLVYTAYDGAEAIRQAAHGPDLVLLDINMPGTDGLTVCEKIRDHISCPILFLTARIETSDKIRGFQAGADDYIVKPFDIDELGARHGASAPGNPKEPPEHPAILLRHGDRLHGAHRHRRRTKNFPLAQGI